ncbi:hypothetical protein [Archangium primigenium]|uniref:hypothetical protein n=1 Tax=[Archangium] primigenium TaxID=2792470 RepID=UPI00195910BF|nr:hypothetical protein [Archangium primigenium]MBM7115553.1 hypothetical protein [Archangium primigenium]
MTDNCGGTLDCGTCSGSQKCGAAEGSPNTCATPPALASCTGLAPIADLEPISGGVRGVRQCYGGWCTSNGYMGRDSVTDLWGFGDDDVWAVGNGLALHWEGSSWRQVELPGYQRLQAVWGANSRDVWAVGAEGVVSRWDGTRWRRLDFTSREDLTGVSGTSAEDVWLVGPNLALHWDGQTLRETPGWTPVEPESHADGTPFTTHVWALGPQDALAAGGDVCQRWNGQTWSRTDCGVKGARDVWASGPDDIWVVGGLYQDYGSVSSTRSHWDGQRWTAQRTFQGLGDLDYEHFSALWGTGPTDVWLNGVLHFDGSKWTRVCRTRSPHRVWGSGSGILFGFSEEHGLVRFDGERWRLTASTWLRVSTVGAMEGDRAWGLTLSGTRLAFDGSRWSASSQGSEPRRTYGRPFGTSPENIWSIQWGEVPLIQWNGQTWSNAPPISDALLFGWAASPTAAFVVGVPPLENTYSVWRWDGTTWTRGLLPHIRPTYILQDIWGSGPDDVWLVGWYPTSNISGEGEEVGLVLHWDGQSWTSVYEQAGHHFRRVSGTSPSNVWILDALDSSDEAPVRVLRWDGRTFQSAGEFPHDLPVGLLAGSGAADMWMAVPQQEYAGTRLYHFDGLRWTPRALVPGRIRSLSSKGGVIFAATEDGILYDYRP